MKLKQLEIKVLDFRCLACGKEIPKGVHQIYHHGDHYTGGHYHKVEGVNMHQDAFVVIETSNILGNLYAAWANNLFAAEKSILEKEIEASVPREEFRQIVIDKKVKELREEYEPGFSAFKEFLDKLHSRWCLVIPYIVNASCAAVIMQNAEKVEKEKFAVENNKESIYRFKAEMKFSVFLNSFTFLAEYLNLHELQSQENIVLEFTHFSDYYR